MALEYPEEKEIASFDGFVKSPSVPFGAGLRFSFVVAAHLLVRLTPQFLHALQGGGKRSVPHIGRETSRPYNQKPSFHCLLARRSS
jgi:hypothetical protein